MARKRKTKGLGASTDDHLYASKKEARDFANAVYYAGVNIRHGSCMAALARLTDASRFAGAVGAHRSSVEGRGKASRSFRQKDAMEEKLGELTHKFLQRCVIK